MKKIFKNKGAKRVTAIALALISLISTIFAVPLSVGAATKEVPITYDYCYDTGGNIITYVKETTNDGYCVGVVGEELCRIYADGKDAYCIQPGHSLYSGDTLTQDASAAWNSLSKAQRKAINLALLFGKSGSSKDLVGTDGQKWIATQLMVWDFVSGCRDASTFKLNNSKFIDGITSGGANPNVKTNYNKIAEKLNNYKKLPSFAYDTSAKASKNTNELVFKDGTYTLTLTDSNKVLSEYTFKTAEGVKVSASGSKLTLTSSKPLDEAVVISATRNMPKVTTTLVACGSSSKQDVVTGVQSDTETTTAYLAVKTSTGSLKLVKTSDDGEVSDVTFNISGPNGYSKTAKTNSKGEFQIDDLVPDTYTVTEVVKDKYETQKSQSVTVESGKTASVSFSNVLKRGSLEVIKSSEDGYNEGVRFHLYGNSLSGQKVDEYASTNAKGVATFKDILVSGDTAYTLEEVDTNIRYVVPKSQTATIEWDKATKREFVNVLKKFTVTVKKTDVEKTVAQGDGTLAGAKYGIYNGEELVDTYTTDKNGSFTTKEYVCGDNWTIRETEPSEGYLLDATPHKVGAEPVKYTVEHNPISMDVTEQVIKGDVSIIKHTDNGETKIETPEVGAEFQVYLKSAGSFENADTDEKDIIVTDEYGFGKTKLLPYGTYTVHQTKSLPGREYINDFDVFVCEDSKTYKYLINDAVFESYIKVVKVDAETGKAIKYSGAGFEIYNPKGEKVSMTFTYPTPETVDVFYTDDEGYLITPEKLEYGTGYQLVEVQAPQGYILDSTPLTFDVTKENSTEESGVTVVKLTKANVAQKGTITVEKHGEAFVGVNVVGGMDSNGKELPVIYQPVYDVTGHKGATFVIKAAEDITTGDGTVRYKKGTVVDTITTDKNGVAESKELYLGKYEITETKAPYGMVNNSNKQTVELVYAGQNVLLTETETVFNNDRQKIKVSLFKDIENNELFGIGNNDEIKNITFGLYACEELVSASGVSIPADGLIEIIHLDENGNGIFNTDLPFGKYYVKEISTDEHYILDDTKYEFEFKYQGEKVDVIEIVVNNREPIINELVYGSVSGKKVDENGKPLGGAVIGLFKDAEGDFTTENALMTTTSADDGSFSFADIPYGTWYVREIEQPTGFVLSETVYPVVIDKNGGVIEIEIANEFIKGNIILEKVDKDYPENKLTGAEFELYEDKNGNGQLDEEDVLINLIKGTDTGIYEMKDLVYGHYLVKEKTAPNGFVLDENTYPVFVDTDGETYKVENKAGVGFINEAMKGSLKIVKTSSDKKLEGFSFKVVGENYDETFKTDKNGEILVEGLRIGKYVVSEVNDEASAGYILSEDASVEIEFDKTTEVKMHNEKIKTPKTGDNRNMLPVHATAGASLSGVIACVVLALKKRKGKEAA